MRDGIALSAPSTGEPPVSAALRLVRSNARRVEMRLSDRERAPLRAE
ncbi:MAG: hypothetical protein ACHREM_15830 [Polyangiales bacterium]